MSNSPSLDIYCVHISRDDSGVALLQTSNTVVTHITVITYYLHTHLKHKRHMMSCLDGFWIVIVSVIFFNSFTKGDVAKVHFSNSLYRTVVWAVDVKLLSGECHRTPLMTSQHWFMKWLGAIRQQAIFWANVDPGLYRHRASLGHNELTIFTYPLQLITAVVFLHDVWCEWFFPFSVIRHWWFRAITAATLWCRRAHPRLGRRWGDGGGASNLT